MSKDEAMKLALETIYALAASNHKTQQMKSDTIQALEEALKQEQGEPVAFVIDRFQGQNTGSTMAEPQVIWIGQVKIGDKIYTTPQQHTWVGLSEEEVLQLIGGMPHGKMIRAVEAKLKEKNT